ncbi:MAG: hypothetical protein AAGC93_12280, partial [Cyanobacteria bacterium P01_F01_bin.53]
MFILIFHSVKPIIYLLLGVTLYNYFEQWCERYNKPGIESVNPVLSLIMVVWGSGGFFFLRFLSLLLPNWLNPLLQVLFTAVPDLGLIFAKWMQYSWLSHPSWLWKSILLPTVLLVISLLVPKPRNHLMPKGRRYSKYLFDLSLGLYVGVSAHLIADLLLFWIPGGDNY